MTLLNDEIFKVAGPMEQFEILPIIPLPFGNLDISFSNSSLWMIIGVSLICGFFFIATQRRALIPGRLQSIAEMMYEFVFDMTQDNIGSDGRKFFPFVFTLFTYILFANFLGLLPSIPGLPHELHVFTTTSHLAVTLTLALATFVVVIVYGFWKNGIKFLKLFAPSGVPILLMPLLVPIEVFSFFIRPVTLAVRLFANMFAGHIILKLFAGFVATLVGLGSAVSLFAIAPFIGIFAMTMLEFLVAGLQAYVFAILTCIYLGEAAHASDH